MKRVNGEGSLYYEKNRNYWRATITLPNGKRKDFCSKSKITAIQKRNRYISNNYSNLVENKMTIVDCCNKYIELFYHQNKFIDSTYLTHLCTIQRIKKSKLADIPISAVNVNDINEFITYEIENKKSISVIRKDKAMLKWGIKYAREMKLIKDDPMDSILIIKNYGEAKSEKVEALTSKEQEKFFEIIKKEKQNLQPYANIWLLAIFTGLRMGEICALMLENIDIDNKKIYVKKTITRINQDGFTRLALGEKTKTSNGERVINYSTVVSDLIDEVIKNRNQNSKFLFSDVYGNFISPSIVTNKLREFNRKNKIAPKITSHILRHTFATRMIEQGFPANVVQHLLGHSSVDITLDTYTSFFEEYEEKYTEKMNQYWKDNS